MDAVKTDEGVEQLAEIGAQLTMLNEQVSYLSEKQRARDELLAEMQPILKDVMGHATERLGALEEQGYFTFAREGMRVLDRIVEGYDEEDVRALGDNIVRIMDTVRAFTQPQMLAIANEATEVIDNADQLEPTGLVGMVRASRDDDVQKGMAVLLGVLRSVGRGVKEMTSSEGRPRERVRPATAAAPTAPPVARRAAAPTARPAVAPVTIDGVEVSAAGYMVDASQWTPELGEAIASTLGISLSEAHWVVLRAAREQYLASGQSPNIRKLTHVSGKTTKEIYQLFPRAPGMTVARIAGTPKPVGCI